MLRKEVPNAKLWIVGSPTDVKMTANSLGLSLKNIEGFHNISHEELMKLYLGAKVTIFPSFYEAFGYVALESMVCGTPVIASPAVVQELIIPSYNGFIANPNDPVTIKDYAHKLLTDEELWQLMSRGCRRIAR